jgi:hypothetical protein
MTSLLPRLAIGASLAVSAISASVQAQVRPEQTKLHRLSAEATKPIVQQSPMDCTG